PPCAESGQSLGQPVLYGELGPPAEVRERLSMLFVLLATAANRVTGPSSGRPTTSRRVAALSWSAWEEKRDLKAVPPLRRRLRLLHIPLECQQHAHQLSRHSCHL